MTSSLGKLFLAFGLGLVALTVMISGFGILVQITIDHDRALLAPWRDATILKICHGSTIYRLRDGRIVAQGGYRVENPETVVLVPFHRDWSLLKTAVAPFARI